MPPVNITAMDKVGAYLAIGKALIAALTALVTYPIRSGPKAQTMTLDVLFAGIRTMFSSMSIASERYLNPSTEETYLRLAGKRNFQPDSVVLSDGTKAHWLGPRKADKIIIFFHGGGYVLPCDEGHFQWLYNMRKELAKSHSVSAIMLGYTTAPEGQYPTQLKQAAELLQYVMEKEGKRPSDIFLGGDSAGGNLAAGLLSHILHPHPQVPAKISLNEPLAGAVLISPWLNFRTADETITSNAKTDIVGGSVGSRWSKAFLGDSPKDNYNQPCIADASWFSGLESVVKDILIWGGGGEVCISAIREMVVAIKGAHKTTEYVEEPGAAHEQMIVETGVGYKTKAQGTLLIEEWIAARF